MAVNPNTLYHLYQNGILDFVPADLAMPSPVGISTPVTNPYLDMAKQGGLYQSAGMTTDSFQSAYNYDSEAHSSRHNYGASAGQNNISGTYNYGGQGYNANIQAGFQSNTGFTGMLNGYGVGAYNNNGIATALGESGSIGSMSQTGGLNSLSGFGVGTAYGENGVNSANGLLGVQNGISSGFNKTMSIINSTPRLVLGVIAGVIGVTGIVLALKRGKKPPKTNTSNTGFWSKLNPLNWKIFKRK